MTDGAAITARSSLTAVADRGRIPFTRPTLFGREMRYIAQAILQGHAAGDGPFTRTAQNFLEETTGAARVLLTTSCTHALEMAALLLDIAPGDEVIVPSYTFVSTANAFALRGASIRFADVSSRTLNMNPDHVARLLSPRTKAIVPVHYAGVGCEMERLVPMAADRGVALVEDNAHGLFGTYRGQHLGTFGTLATLSFHETKNLTCGEGGALMINDPTLVERAEIIREKGTNRSRFFRGEVDKYTWVGLGSSYVLSDVLAAFLCGQLEERTRIADERARVWNTYAEQLADWAREEDVQLPCIPAHCNHTHHAFFLIMPNPDARSRIIAALREAGILAVFHYQPLHLSPMGVSFGGKRGDCPVTEWVAESLVRLPLYNNMPPADQERVIETVRSFRCGSG